MSCCVDEEREARKDSPRSCNPNGKTLKPQFNELIYFSNDIISKRAIGTLWYGCTVAQVSVCPDFKLRTAILREWRKIHASNVRNKVAAIFFAHTWLKHTNVRIKGTRKSIQCLVILLHIKWTLKSSILGSALLIVRLVLKRSWLTNYFRQSVLWVLLRKHEGKPRQDYAANVDYRWIKKWKKGVSVEEHLKNTE